MASQHTGVHSGENITGFSATISAREWHSFPAGNKQTRYLVVILMESEFP